MENEKQCRAPSRHLASLMLGLIALTWAPIPILAPTNMRMVYELYSINAAWVWVLWWLAIGGMLVFGSLAPCRYCRMVALGMSAFGWFSFLWVYMQDWLYSPSTMSMLVYVIMSVITLVSDVRGKPRDDLDTD